ncbi:baculoviral IAP repeat-containing protein 5 [Lingula anatina]|uniref:Baculoviral IAP repeat-containing protein 5 n=1 Tax=Lingula anatina TaxID=7574 RepID=A0A1S3HK52_LINAN|nr:baculoviral IAP repeat-containing protein 5 [Lingula anatina]|eukprot:XP_013385374.1 baculoviral IAP repeat-containing protein 5 [Lingula anatina]
MKVEDIDMTEEEKMFRYNLPEHRLASFNKWPFTSNCTCTPEKMAAAGFYHCPTDQAPDLVKCFVCCKELEGWEPDDDPWKEHESHSASCPFLAHGDSCTMAEFFKTECTRQTIRIMKSAESKIAEFEKFAVDAREELENLVQMNN